MPFGAGPVAYFLPSGSEFVVLLVIGVMLFGRRLPEVARTVGKSVAQFRRSFDNFKRELNADESLRDVRDSVQGLRRAVDAPRRLADPRRLFEDLTDEHRSTPAPSSTVPASAVPDASEPHEAPADGEATNPVSDA